MMNKYYYKDTKIEIMEGDSVYVYDNNHKVYEITSFNIGVWEGTCVITYHNDLSGFGKILFDNLTFIRRKETVSVVDRYIGYGKQLDLPSGRVGIELTINNLKELVDELEKSNKVSVMVLPVKPENVTAWRTHSVKISENKYKK